MHLFGLLDKTRMTSRRSSARMQMESRSSSDDVRNTGDESWTSYGRSGGGNREGLGSRERIINEVNHSIQQRHQQVSCILSFIPVRAVKIPIAILLRSRTCNHMARRSNYSLSLSYVINSSTTVLIWKHLPLFFLDCTRKSTKRVSLNISSIHGIVRDW